MPDVSHRGYRLRLLVEQVLDVRTHSPTPVDAGRSERVITHEERVIDISDSDFSAAIINPVKAVNAYLDPETGRPKT